MFREIDTSMIFRFIFILISLTVVAVTEPLKEKANYDKDILSMHIVVPYESKEIRRIKIDQTNRRI